MSIAHLLEDFTIQAGTGALHLLDDDALEELRLAAFEQGYSAGWEDAVQAREQTAGQFSADLAKSLQDMSFTYHEAVACMSQSLEPMFSSLVNVVLPETLDRGFATRLAEQLSDMAREQITQPMQVFVPQGRMNEVEQALPQGLSPPPQVLEDANLSEGQARLQVGVSRRKVDCQGLLTAIGQAFDAYVFHAKEVSTHE